jgi:hypothetical protein
MKKIAAALFCLFALLLSSSGAWGAEPIPSSEPGWYKCTGDGQEKTVSENSEVKSPLINKVRDAYSVKRPEAKEVTVVVGKMPASLPKFSKGWSFGAVAVSRNGKSVRGKIVPVGSDNRIGQVPAVAIFEDKVEADALILGSDRWFENSLLSEKRGEVVIFNLHGRHTRLQGGMFLGKDEEYTRKMAIGYGNSVADLMACDMEISEVEAAAKKSGAKKLQTPDGSRYTPVDMAVFKKLYAQPALVSWWECFLNNGGIAIGIPPEPIGAAVNVGVAALTATFDTRHNIPWNASSWIRNSMNPVERSPPANSRG